MAKRSEFIVVFTTVHARSEYDMATPPIFNFFKKVEKGGLPLPKPSSPLHNTVNKDVERELRDMTPTSSGKKRKRYGDYSSETRAKIAKYAIQNGNTAAARHFSNALDMNISESTVRGMKSAYEKMKKNQRKVSKFV